MHLCLYVYMGKSNEVQFHTHGGAVKLFCMYLKDYGGHVRRCRQIEWMAGSEPIQAVVVTPIGKIATNYSLDLIRSVPYDMVVIPMGNAATNY